jgi:UDP-N-acetylglucosamine--N-acetylmuramyl-(pentapeptide) pyrophosphoryl-undecaprenol N-acetylglucosamine transferase
LIKSRKPDLVIGLGGFAAGPVLLAASLLRTPTALLEQNAHVGLTNRLLSRTVGRAYLTYQQTAVQFGPERARVFGNPVRRQFVQAARIAATDPEGLEARSRDLFVLGGSQGAQVLNEVIPVALQRAGFAGRGLTVVHQTGEAMQQQVSAFYRQAGIEARVSPFIHDMVRAYASARLVIARAGATTLAELCAIGRASILVPYPYAADDHQTKNAAALQQQGAAVMMPQDHLTPELLAQELTGLLDDDACRRAMADAARRQGRPDAAADIVDDLGAWLGLPSPETPSPDHDPSSAGSPPVPRGAFSLPLGSSLQQFPSVALERPKLKQKKLPVHTA